MNSAWLRPDVVDVDLVEAHVDELLDVGGVLVEVGARSAPGW